MHGAETLKHELRDQIFELFPVTFDLHQPENKLRYFDFSDFLKSKHR